MLARKLGMGPVLAIIIGTVIGSGVFINLPIVAKATGSPILAILAWTLGGIIWIPQIFILAELASAYPNEGFGYLYLKEAGNRPLAFLYVWTAFWTSDTPSITIIAMAAISALSVFWPALAGAAGKFFAAALILSLMIPHIRDVRFGGFIQIGLTVAKVSPLVLLAVIGLFHFIPSELFIAQASASSTKSLASLLLAGVAGTVWSYAGFPNILYMAGEVRQAERNLPRALFISVFAVTIGYILIATATAAIVPHQELVQLSGKFANPFQYLPMFASIATGFLAIAAFVSMVGATNACIMVQPRLEYAIARDGYFFKVFGAVHSRYQTPHASIIIQCLLAIGFIFIGNIESLLGYFTLSYVLQNALVYYAIFPLRRKPEYQPTFRAPCWRIFTLLAIGTQLYLAYGTFITYPVGGVLAAAGLIITGLPMYFYFKSRIKNSPGLKT